MPAGRKKTTRKTKKRSVSKKKKISLPWPWICLALLLLFLFLHRTDLAGFFAKNPAPDMSAETNKPKMVFVIDDIGYHRDHEQKLLQLKDRVVYAILPMLPFSKHFAALGHKAGADVILHLPLETVSGTIPGRGLITREMEPAYVEEMLDRDLSSVPYHIGSNNHMGSLGTSDPVLMRTILTDIKKRNLFFLDSVTTGQSVIPQIAKELNLPFFVRDIFLDNIDAKQAVLNQIKKQKSIARQKGYAIGIGHYRDTTLSVLIDMIPKLEEEGFEITSLSKLQKKIS